MALKSGGSCVSSAQGQVHSRYSIILVEFNSNLFQVLDTFFLSSSHNHAGSLWPSEENYPHTAQLLIGSLTNALALTFVASKLCLSFIYLH